MHKFDKLIEKIGFGFNDEKIIRQAFIHRSYLNENKDFLLSNERLEFLGDSILSFLVSEYLYQKYPNFTEGELTNLRSSVVKTTTLAKLAKSLDLGSLLSLSKGEEESGGRNNTSLLADTFESFLGSVYLDRGLESIIKILNDLLFPLFDGILKDKAYKDAKSELQEIVQEQIKLSPVYKVVSETGPDHAKQFTIGVYIENKLRGTGIGKSKQEGEMNAAKAALEKWERKEYNANVIPSVARNPEHKSENVRDPSPPVGGSG